MERLQFARRGGRIAVIVLPRVSLPRSHPGQKILHLRFVRDQLPVEVARIVVDQDATHVEDDYGGAGKGTFWGQITAFP